MSDFSGEYKLLQTGAALFLLPGRGVIEVQGKDRVGWLNGMLTADIASLKPEGPNNCCRTLLLSRQGRIIADLHVLVWRDMVWLELSRQFIPKVIGVLGRYIVADDVVLRDASEDLKRYCLEGATSQAVLDSCVGPTHNFAQFETMAVTLDDVVCWVANYRLAGPFGTQWFVPAQKSAMVQQFFSNSHSIKVLESDDLLDLLRIEEGRPELGIDLDESVLPDEARLGNTISESKGCYTGQEVIARLRSRGRLKYLLVGLALEGELDKGTSLLQSGEQVGEVTSVARSPHWGFVGMGYVRIEQSEPGTVLEAEGVSVRVVELPLLHHS